MGENMNKIRRLALAVTLLAAAAGCSSSTSSSSTAGPTAAPNSAPTQSVQPTDSAAPSKAGTITVPDDVASIQAAVTKAKEGDLILIKPGVYHEAVTVQTANLTIRGLDRNTTILDGEFKLDNGIRVVGANGVAIENLTARNYTKNGFFWTGVTGYRGSYLTAFRNGDYGVYAFLSTKGQIEHSYGAGSPDAGFYVGGCFPCDTLLNDLTSEYNGLGYSGTNSGGNLIIVNSIFRFNRAGVVPNSGSYELCYPERNSTIIGNIVYSNNQPDTPAIDVSLLAMGNGILAAGGVGNDIERNLVYDHDKTGIGLVPFLEEDPNDNPPKPDAWTRTCAETRNDPVPDPATVTKPAIWDPMNNRVIANVIENSRVADIAQDSPLTALDTLNNCFSGNTFTTSAPTALEQIFPCDATGNGGDWKVGSLNVLNWLNEKHPPSQDYKTSSPEPPKQTNMPNAATASARPATDVPEKIDTASIKVPSKPAP